MKKSLVFYCADEARILGLTQSVIYNQLRYWINFNEKRNQNYFDGCYWTFFNINQLEDLLGIPSRTLYDNLRSLEKKGFIKTGNYNKLRYDRTKWYSLTQLTPLESNTDYISTIMEPVPPTTETNLPNTEPVDDNYGIHTSQLRKSDNNTRVVKESKRKGNKESNKNSNNNTNSGDFLEIDIFDKLDLARRAGITL
jgi:hypothetical protein